MAATTIDAATIRLTPAATPYELLRQAAGLEVHQQGQGPGFGSDVSLRGFSSDHATDVALWVDGVPMNEPVNGHAEGYNDFSVLFPGGIRDIDVIHGPTSALFGNFALAGTVNVRTLDRMAGSELTASGGSFGRADLMGMTGFDHGARGGGVLGARYVQENGFRPNSRYDIAQGHARVVHDLSRRASRSTPAPSCMARTGIRPASSARTSSPATSTTSSRIRQTAATSAERRSG